MTTIIGITGGIASGKSTFTKELVKRGYKVQDSDAVVSDLYKKPPKEFIKHLKKIKLAKSINSKKINKKYISKIIFSNKNIKTKLESYIFNHVRGARETFISNEKKNKTKFIFLDIPLLFENNLDKTFDIIVVIISNKTQRLKRVRSNKKVSTSLFNQILKFQTSDVVRKKRSDIVIYNNKSIKDYLIKIDKNIKKITE